MPHESNSSVAALATHAVRASAEWKPRRDSTSARTSATDLSFRQDAFPLRRREIDKLVKQETNLSIHACLSMRAFGVIIVRWSA